MIRRFHHHTSHPFVALATLAAAVALGAMSWIYPAQAAQPSYTAPNGLTFRYPSGWSVQPGKKVTTIVPNASTRTTLQQKKVSYGLTVAHLNTNGSLTTTSLRKLESGWTEFLSTYSLTQAKAHEATASTTTYTRKGWTGALVTLRATSGTKITTWKIYLLTKDKQQVYAVTETWSGSVLPITAAGPLVASTVAGVVPKYVAWDFNGSTWAASGTPPPCPSPLRVPLPIDESKVTSILYPGQVRGGNYKPHGGFRLDSSTTGVIDVRAPFDSYVVSGTRYTEMGETQYLFDLYSPCGLRVRFDHLATLSPAFAAIAEKFPAPTESSQTTKLATPVKVRAGDLLATAVGHLTISNYSFDFGVYDLRKRNQASADSAWAATHAQELEMGAYGLCWLTLLPEADRAVIGALPATDQVSGAQSDYCR